MGYFKRGERSYRYDDHEKYKIPLLVLPVVCLQICKFDANGRIHRLPMPPPSYIYSNRRNWSDSNL